MPRQITHAVRILALTLSLTVSGAVLAEFAEGRILVKPAAGLKAENFEKILRKIEKRARVKRRLRRSRVHMIDVPRRAERRIAGLLARHPHIAFAELDQRVKPDAIVNDPKFDQQWHLPKMGADAAWQFSDGNGVVVAVLDTGVNPNHPDLSGQVVSGWNTVANNTDTSDINNHGTWVAGVIAARMNNATGGASVAPGSKVMPIRITDDPDGWAYFSEMAEGIMWAADNGARVANLSYNGAAGSSSVAYAANYMMSKGGVVMVSAGNDNTDYGYINHPSLYVAGATNVNDAKAKYSNFGSYVDISAPGSGIFTTARNGGYSTVSGTSFASPNTAAVAALIMAANPTLLPTDVLAIIGNTAVDLGSVGWDPEFGYGRVDAQAAAQVAAGVETSDTEAPQVGILDPTHNAAVSELVSITVEAVDAFGVTEVELLVDGQPVATEPQSGGGYQYVFSWDSTAVANGSHQLVARARDAAGNVGVATTISVNVNNTQEDSVAPTVRITSPAADASGSGSVFLAAQASDNVGVTEVRIYAAGKLRCAGTTSASCNWNLRNVSPGPKTIIALASDAAGNQRRTLMTFNVEASVSETRSEKAGDSKGRSRKTGGRGRRSGK